MNQTWKPSHVFLTGATGLIGGEFAKALARQLTKVSCLVRASESKSSGERLIRRVSEDNQRLSDSELKYLFSVEGDVRSEDLGMPRNAIQSLTDSVDLIIHSAAETSFIRDENCREININGTKKVIEFAKKCKKNPLLVYISTACNIGEASNQCLDEDQGCQPLNKHHNAYTQSKAVAEALIKNSGLNVLIIRPSIVLSAGLEDSKFARQILWVAPVFNKFDCLPIDKNAKVDIVPVSFVVNATLKLVSLPNRKHDCYHLSAGADYSVRLGDLTELFGRHYGHEKGVEAIPAAEWKKEHTRKFVVTREQRKLYFAFRHYLPFLNMDVVFDNRRLRTETDVENLGLVTPEGYLPHLLSKISLDDALTESFDP